MDPRMHVMGALILGLACGSAFGCGPAGSPLPTASGSPVPYATPSASVSAATVTRTWVFGSGNEPSPGPVVGCYPFKVWNLKQNGAEVTGDVNACVGPCAAFTEATKGLNAQGRITLSGTERESPGASPGSVSYDLTFQTRTGHLVGTRNGASFWAAPFVQRPSQDCGPAPL